MKSILHLATITHLRSRTLALTEGAALAFMLGTFRISEAACHYQQATQGLQNPLCANSVTDFVQLVLQAFVAISLPILSFFFVYAGFKFVMAQGKPADIAAAKKNFYWLIAGAILILGAWALAQLIGNTVDNIAGIQ